ncbi:hypothetical protein D9M68_736490 [compost metagenome]
MPAELALHRLLRHLALVQLDHGFGKLGHVAAGRGPVQIATVGAGSRVLGLLLGDVFKLGAALERGDDGLGFVFLFHQDVAGAVFLATIGRSELVVLGLHLGVAHRVLLLVVGEQRTDQDGLAGQFHLGFVFGSGGDASLLRFLHEDLAQHHFFFQLRTHGVIHRAAGRRHLLRQRLHARGGHGFAVHDGHVLRGGPGRSDDQGGRGQGRQGKFHGVPRVEKRGWSGRVR